MKGAVEVYDIHPLWSVQEGELTHLDISSAPPGELYPASGCFMLLFSLDVSCERQAETSQDS